MQTNDHLALMKALVPVAREAGEKVLEIYEKGVEADFKTDGSPVTEADQAAEAIILKALAQIVPEITIISEENAASHSIDPPQKFFLVDPLDGTREFVKRDGKGSFTVNIALIEDGRPMMGIVYAPVLDRMFTGVTGVGSTENDRPIKTRKRPAEGCTAVASVSHRDELTNAWLVERKITNTVSIGSSLKFCLLATGEADVYPRFSPTMEWDTAAGQAILVAAGGAVVHPFGEPFEYGKAQYRNSAFIAHSGNFKMVL